VTRTRAILFIAILAVGAWLTGSPEQAQAQPGGITTGSGPLLGAYAQPINGQTNIQATQILEQTLGTNLGVVRAFAEWDDAVGADKPLHVWTRDGGRELMVSVKPRRANGTVIRWRQIADAQPGSTIYREMQTLAQGVRSYGSPMIFGFHHEPEQGENTQYGSSTDFKAAYRKIHSVFEAEGVTNAHWVWIMTEWSFEVGDFNPGDRRVAQKWYPGDDVVDLIASDTYNWNNCRGNTSDPWQSLEDELEPLMRFAAQHPGKQLVLGEFGSDDGAPGQKAQWLADAQALFKTAPYKDSFAALLYFHDDGREEGVPACNWWLDSTNASEAAASQWFGDAFYAGSLKSPATPSFARCDGRVATRIGTSSADRIVGTSGVDVIVGLGGNDELIGMGGDDFLCGGPGDDELKGGNGADRLFGDRGKDFILGGYGPDVLVGGYGADRMNGQNGNDELFGSQGNDVMRGGPHQDVLRGGDNADIILGQGGWDTIYGGNGNDNLSGGVGADTIVGGPGNDRCNGNQGNDQVNC